MYYDNEIENILGLGPVKIKLISQDRQTKWLDINEESIPVLLDFLSVEGSKYGLKVKNDY